MKSLLIVFLVLIACLPNAGAKTVAIPSDHFSIDIPDTWTESPKPGLLYSAADDSQSSAIAILSFPNAQNQTIDTEYINGVKKGMAEQASKTGATTEVVGEGPITIGGVPSYWIESKIGLPGSTTIYQRIYSIPANGKMYALSLQSTDAGKDSELQGIANSLRFDSPPELPDPMKNSLFYKVGEVVGFLLFLLAAFLTIRFLARLITRTARGP